MVRDPILDTMYCILDGLDECDEASCKVLLKNIRSLFHPKAPLSSTCNFNLIVVSRDFPRFISDCLSDSNRIKLDEKRNVNSDIDRFIEIEVNKLSKHEQYPQALSVYVEGEFRKRIGGTFLWVGIVARELWYYAASDIEAAMELFPPGLDSIYARLLLQIDAVHRETAAKILRWVVMAVRPLTLSELSIVIGSAPDSVRTVNFSHEEAAAAQVLYRGHFFAIKKGKVGLNYTPIS